MSDLDTSIFPLRERFLEDKELAQDWTF